MKKMEKWWQATAHALMLVAANILNKIAARHYRSISQPDENYINGFKNRFAFFIHPRSSAIEDMGKSYRIIHFIGWVLRGKASVAFEQWLRKLGLLLDPWPIPCFAKGHSKPIGWIIAIPIMGEYLMSKDHRKTSLLCMQKGVRLASKLGAKVLGLGALTAPATRSGKDLLEVADECGIKITTGNELTAGITAHERLETAPSVKENPRSSVITILGAIGSVGKGVSETLLRYGCKVLCIDVRYALLQKFQQEMTEKGYGDQLEISEDPARIGEGLYPILVTNGVKEFLDENLHIFQPGSVIIDDTQPRAMKRNPDRCLVIDGGVLKLSNIKIGLDIGLAPQLAYACLTETILMAYEGRLEHHVGESSADGAQREMESFWRNQHLVQIAPYRSFGKNIKAKRFHV